MWKDFIFLRKSIFSISHWIQKNNILSLCPKTFCFLNFYSRLRFNNEYKRENSRVSDYINLTTQNTFSVITKLRFDLPLVSWTDNPKPETGSLHGALLNNSTSKVRPFYLLLSVQSPASTRTLKLSLHDLRVDWGGFQVT